jgi:DNA-dependent RNA polymerase auxiliary subunit epsilon
MRIKYSFEQKIKNSLTNEEYNTSYVADLKDEHHYIYEMEEDRPPV